MAVALKHDVVKIYDPAAGTPVQGVDEHTSVESLAPDLLFIEGLDAVNVCLVQVRPSEDAIWYDLTEILGATDSDAIVYIDRRFNFVRTVRTAGANDFKAFIQE